MKGFTVYAYKDDWFFPTDRKNVTEKLVKMFIERIWEAKGFHREALEFNFPYWKARIYPAEVTELKNGQFSLSTKFSGTIIDKRHIVRSENDSVPYRLQKR